MQQPISIMQRKYILQGGSAVIDLSYVLIVSTDDMT